MRSFTPGVLGEGRRGGRREEGGGRGEENWKLGG